MPTSGSGITSVATKFRKARRIPIRWKLITLNSVTTWLGWLESLVVFLVARMRWSVPYVYLFTASTVGNFTNSVFLPMQPMSWISLAHCFRHSLPAIYRTFSTFRVTSIPPNPTSLHRIWGMWPRTGGGPTPLPATVPGVPPLAKFPIGAFHQRGVQSLIQLVITGSTFTLLQTKQAKGPKSSELKEILKNVCSMI